MAKRKFTTLSGTEMERTVARRLVPVADGIRDLATKFGIRPYRVRIVKLRWTGGQRGRGVAIVEAETELLPTPKVSDLSSLTELLQPIGANESGGVQVSEISARYAEAELSDHTDERDVEIFWEIEYPAPSGPGPRRRFVVRSAPQYNAGSLEWVVRLERAHHDRARNGDTRG